MVYTLNRYFKKSFSNSTAPRVVIYPNNTTAAQLLNYHKNKGSTIIHTADCLPETVTQLPMPNALMKMVDAKAQSIAGRSLIVGIDAYLALLEADGITVFMSELRSRLDEKSLNVDYLLSSYHTIDFAPRYFESLSVVRIEGEEDVLKPICVDVYSDTWVKPDGIGGIAGYGNLLQRLGPYMPDGSYNLVLPGLTEKQAGIGNAVSFVLNIREIAVKYYGIDADLDDFVLKPLLTQISETGQQADAFLANTFGESNYDARAALKRLLELKNDDLFAAYIWLLRKKLPGNLYIARVLSEDITPDTLVWKYAVDTAISVLSDENAKNYSSERAEAIKALDTGYEPLIVEFIGRTKNDGNALQFLNCGTTAERIEIVRRAAKEDLLCGLPRQYGELFPALADYFSDSFDYGDAKITAYFKEYRRLKISGSITDSFLKQAFDASVQTGYPARDTILGEMREQPDSALLIVDAMGAEYMPLLLAMAKRYGLQTESPVIAEAKLPTETTFNPIKWNGNLLPAVKGVDNVVHDGAEKHETSTPERNFAETLRKFEIGVMNRIAEGLNRFSRVVVTADHGATRLAVVARNEGKSVTLPWNRQRDGQPLDWRYSLAPAGIARPPEYESEYFPDSQKTYWIVRGYSRLPKGGCKLYELHGGATLEERLVPVVVFTKRAVSELPDRRKKAIRPEVIDEFEGLI